MSGEIWEEIEEDLGETLEDDFGLPVEFLSPTTKEWQKKSENDPDSDLSASILYETIENDAAGEVVYVVKRPEITVRKSSLLEVPTDKNYELWFVRIPERPSTTAPKVTCRIHLPPEGGETIGFLRFFLERVKQS